MTIHFTKMHGLGNDFIVIDGINQKLMLTPEQITTLANRSTGVGFDQCLVIEPSNNEKFDFLYRIFNADGHEVGQCGNGARCIALFARHYGLTKKDKLLVATNTTQMELSINADNSVSVNMGKPKLAPSAIPLNMPEQLDQYAIVLNNEQTIYFHSLSVGNPHAAIVVQDVTQAPVQLLGEQISFHPLFPEQTNVEFMQILNDHHIKLRVYERGCGETIACGSGAVAAAAIGRLFHNLAEQITVSLPGGDLIVTWPDTEGDIVLTGPAAFVYEGKIIS